MEEEIAKSYTIYTDLMDDFEKERFLELLSSLESIGCIIHSY